MIFTKETLCKNCKITLENEISRIEEEIITTKSCSQQQLELLKRQLELSSKQNKEAYLTFYSRIYEKFEGDKELEEVEMKTLQKIQEVFNLTNEDVNFDERIKPYIYVNYIRKFGKLPIVDLKVEGGSQIILKTGEIVHFTDNAALKELKTVKLGYSGGSQGISFRICKGVRYRIGTHRGNIIKEDRLIETSRGVLIITNQRIFLHPFLGYKPVSIPLNKILSYQAFGNGIEVYKEGREKGYFFSMSNSGSVEIMGICLSYLLEQN